MPSTEMLLVLEIFGMQRERITECEEGGVRKSRQKWKGYSDAENRRYQLQNVYNREQEGGSSQNDINIQISSMMTRLSIATCITSELT